MLDKNLSRIQGAVLVLKTVLGKTDADQVAADTAILSTFVDADKVPTWATGWMALAVKEGVIIGTTKKELLANGSLYGKDLASMFMNTLGFSAENVYNKAVELLAAKSASTLVDAALISELTSAKLTRDAASAIVFDALTATAKDGTRTVIENYVGTSATLKAIAEKAGLMTATVALNVKSASAVTNAKIKVVLNAAATQADVDATTISFVDSAAKAVAVKSATIAADGKSFIVATDAMTAGSLYKLTVGTVTKSIVGLPADTTKPGIDTANSVVKTNTSFEVKFNEKVDDATATNVANYIIDNSLTVLKAVLADDGKTVTLTTSAQKVGTIYTLTVQSVADFSANVMDKATILFGGMAPDTTKPTVVDGSTVVDGNTSFTVKFAEKVSTVTATNIANYTFDNGLTALKAELNSDEDTVTLTTSAQTVGTIYKLTIQNVADVAGNVMDKKEVLFGGMAPDTTKPTVVDGSTVVTTNTTFKVVFDGKVSAATATNIANYTADNGLTVLKSALADDGITVTLTTSAQTVGTIYKLTIQNVADIAGNVMDKKEVLFGGMAVDTGAPTVSSVTSSANTVVITYGEALSTDLATELGNYAFDGGLGYPLSAVLSADETVVTLTTLAQTPSKVYNVTINNVTDLSGNTIAKDTKKSFLGSGSVSTTEVRVQAISIVNNNTFDVIFNSDISDSDLATLTVSIDKENGVTYVAPVGLAGTKIRQDNKKVVRLQYQVTGNTNPEVFKNGKYYQATIGGVANLVVADSAAVKNFAGTSVANVAPYVAVATPINKTAVKVTFSEPVKGIAAGTAGFAIMQGANNIAVTANSVSDITKAVTEVTLYLNTTTPLDQGKVYEITMLGSSLTDAAGIMAIKTLNSDNTTYKVSFGGTNVANAAPKMQAVVATDKYNFDVIFTEEVNAAAKDILKYSVAYTEAGTAKTLVLTNADIAQDGAKISIKLDKADVVTLKSGIAYTLTLTTSAIADLQGLAYDTTAGANKVIFGGTDSANAVPTIVGVEATASVTASAIKVIFSENVFIDIIAPGTVFTVTNGTTTYTVTGIVVDGANVTLSLAASLTSSSISTIKVAAATLVKDVNGQDANTDAVNFGAK